MQLSRTLATAAIAVLLITSCSDASSEPTTTPPAPSTTAPPSTTQPPVTSTLAPTTSTTTTTMPAEVITIWADETTSAALEALGRDFATRRGVGVEVIELPFPSIRSDVLAAVGTDDAPDLFIGAHSWTGPLRDAGAITPVRGIPQAQRDEFIGPALEAFRIDGDLYAVPYAA